MQWMVEEKELRIIHYTLGPLKPWDWYTAWLIKPVEVWQVPQACRSVAELKLLCQGLVGVKTLMISTLSLFYFVFLSLYKSPSITVPSFRLAMRDLSGQGTLCVFGKRLISTSRAQSFLSTPLWPHPRHLVPTQIRWFVGLSWISSFWLPFTDRENGSIPPLFGLITSVAWIVSLGTSLGVAFMLIPLQVTPGTCLLLMYELTFTSFFLLFNGYLRLVHRWGSAVGNRAGHDDPSGKGHQRYILNSDAIAILYWIIMALLAIFAPLWPILLGVSSLFAKLGMMVAGGVVLAVFMDHATIYLAKLAFIKGKKNSDLSRS
ncbi:Hexosyltransferase [Rhynchospora pubera]|uniref:Hexosyltransferase n=1 Tax=Rhynchospora pubera TaxID=906938 RepID=A0AAV8E471_9POAL|nr:Hexosyltransferase [Rhynchospora pubera]